MRIFTCEEPVVRTACDEVDTKDTNELARCIQAAKAASKLMYETHGCGIAAPQVGINKRFIVVDVEYDDKKGIARNPIVMVNPRITKTSKEQGKRAEGCLSVPGVNIVIERPKAVTVEYIDENGNAVTLPCDGMFARCVQHEIDHLDGVTIIERATAPRRIAAIARYSEAKNMGAAPGKPAIYIVR